MLYDGESEVEELGVGFDFALVLSFVRAVRETLSWGEPVV